MYHPKPPNTDFTTQIGIRVAKIDVQLLEILTVQDRAGKGAVVRRLIHEEARRRNIPIPDEMLAIPDRD